MALVATGAAAAYLDVVAVTSGYGWVRPAPGSCSAGLVAVGGLHLARRWGSELLAVLLVAGAAGLAPVVAQGFAGSSRPSSASSCIAGWWAGGNRTHPALTLVADRSRDLSLVAGAVDCATRTGSTPLGQLAVGVRGARSRLSSPRRVSVRRDPRDVVGVGGGGAR